MKVTKEERDTIFKFLYILFKGNFFSRDNMKQLFKVMQGDLPEDIEGYFLGEVSKLKGVRKHDG